MVNSNTSKPHIAFLASPGLGHLIPIVELAKRVVAQHGFTVTVFAVITKAHSAEEELLRDAAASSCNGLFNTAAIQNVVDVSKLDPNMHILSRMLTMVKAAVPTLRSSISSMKIKPTAIVMDQFGTEAIKVANEFNIVKYVLIASNAWFLAYNLYSPYVQKPPSENEPLYIPGCEPISGRDLLPLTFDSSSVAYKDFNQMGLDITTVDGILVNTWEDLEARTLESFKDDLSMNPIVKVPVYPIGPVVRMPKLKLPKTKLIEWLDRQPNESVVYVSFGSGGTISTQQTIELAWGLETSKQRFLWVIRPPIENDRAASLFTRSENQNFEELISESLPNGFLDRTREVGIVVPMWAPQEEILAHRSVGVFVCHCGWNSVLESIVNGVPIITWPLYAEQGMNSTMLVDNLGIAVRPKVRPRKELVGREEIAKLVRSVMVDKGGLSIRRRVNELKVRANEALKEGGSSYSALSRALDRQYSISRQ